MAQLCASQWLTMVWVISTIHRTLSSANPSLASDTFQVYLYPLSSHPWACNGLSKSFIIFGVMTSLLADEEAIYLSCSHNKLIYNAWWVDWMNVKQFRAVGLKAVQQASWNHPHQGPSQQISRRKRVTQNKRINSWLQVHCLASGVCPRYGSEQAYVLDTTLPAIASELRKPFANASMILFKSCQKVTDPPLTVNLVALNMGAILLPAWHWHWHLYRHL